MSLVWINCIRRLKEEAQDAAQQEKERQIREKQLLDKQKQKKSKTRKVSFNSIVHVNRTFAPTLVIF